VEALKNLVSNEITQSVLALLIQAESTNENK
jgi:hypothetical protein